MKKYRGLEFTALAISFGIALCGCNIQKTEPEDLISADAVLTRAPMIVEPAEEPVPEPVISLSTTLPEQGGYIIIRADEADLSGLRYTDFLGSERFFSEYDGGYISVIPVDTATKPGDYTLNFSKDEFEYSTDITVVKRKFDEQYLEVAQETLEETLGDKAARDEFAEKMGPLKEIFTETPLWNGEFICPLKVEYKVTTSFGTFRTFSSGDTEYHNAYDMAAKGGSPVYATNSGNVVFADFLKLTGNTVVIDHGMGFLSWHYHMKKLNVSEGDFVEKGALIGEVGTTGLSTGNHLHFGITACGTFIDPFEMVGKEPDIDFWKTENLLDIGL